MSALTPPGLIGSRPGLLRPNPGLEESNFSHLFSSNAVPKPAEVSSVHGKIADLKHQIQLEHLILQRLEDEVKRHQALFSPVRRIPPTVLGEIFWLLMPEKMDKVGRKILGSLCQVCKSWRDAARQTCQLWNNIRINVSQVSARGYERIQVWLSRSGNVPRRITIEDPWSKCACPMSNCRLTSCVALLKLLTDGPSLDHLHIDKMDGQCIQNLLNLLHSSRRHMRIRPWDSLRSLSLNIHYSDSESGQASTKYIDIDPPLSVTSFHLYLPDIRPQGVVVTTGFFEGLTSLSVKSQNGVSLLRLLQLCVDVEVLTISLDMDPSSHEKDPLYKRLAKIGLTFPKVHTMRLRNIGFASIPFIDMFTTPALTDLDISFQPDASDTNPLNEKFTSSFKSCLYSLIQMRSRCTETLHSLRVHHVHFGDSQEIAALLIGLPALTHLTLDRTIFDDTDEFFFKLKAAAAGRLRSFSKLRVLELLQVMSDFELEGTMFEFLLSLFDGKPVGNSVRKLTVTYYRNRDIDKNNGVEDERLSATKDDSDAGGLDGSKDVSVLRRELGILVDIGPRRNLLLEL